MAYHPAMPIKTATLTDHARRIARAMAHLAERPDRTPSLDELAAVAAFSPYHFHRAYRALAGETPMETLARLRLSRAAASLIKTDAPMARIAREAGFGSVPAFTRAFREAHGLPPGAYRARSGIGAGIGAGIGTEDDMLSDVEIVEFPALHLAGLPHHGPYDAIGAAFARLGAWAGARGLMGPGSRSIGLYHDDPKTVPADKLRAHAAVTVPHGTPVEPGMDIIATPPLRCARLRFKGPYVEIEAAYERLYGDWLPASGEEPADHPMMEEYLNDPRALPPTEWLTDILMPLRPR